ncbi:hypothetical protein [Raineya sp.]|jgi:hypothetical protein
MKTCSYLFIFCLLFQFAWGQVQKPNQSKPNALKDAKTNPNKSTPQKNTIAKPEQKAQKDTTRKNKIVKPYKPPKNPADSALTLEQLLEQSIIIDSTCPRCKGYKHDKFCDGLYCYGGKCSACKGYQKCIHCDGTMYKEKVEYLKFDHLEGCPECTDGKCRICKGTGLCDKCKGSGVMPCSRCKGTGLKSPEQIKAEKIKKVEEEKRRMREREAKEMLNGG